MIFHSFLYVCQRVSGRLQERIAAPGVPSGLTCENIATACAPERKEFAGRNGSQQAMMKGYKGYGQFQVAQKLEYRVDTSGGVRSELKCEVGQGTKKPYNDDGVVYCS